MSTSLTSSEVLREEIPQPTSATRLADLVGRTPLVRLQRSGDGFVWIKREGRNPTGSFFDRVVRHQLAASTGPVIVRGWTQHALAVLAQSRTSGREVLHVVGLDEDIRLRALCMAHGVRPIRVASADEVADEVARLSATGATVLSPTDAQAHSLAWQELTSEVLLAARTLPGTWLVTDFGVSAEVVRAAISGEAGQQARIEVVPWDRSEERPLDGPVACRRQQTGQREGLLLSPLGAELVESGVNAALHRQHEVCVVLPEDGHRYLGWW